MNKYGIPSRVRPNKQHQLVKSTRTSYSFFTFSSLFFNAGSLATVRKQDTKNIPKMIHRELELMFFQVSLSG